MIIIMQQTVEKLYVILRMNVWHFILVMKQKKTVMKYVRLYKKIYCVNMIKSTKLYIKKWDNKLLIYLRNFQMMFISVQLQIMIKKFKNIIFYMKMIQLMK